MQPSARALELAHITKKDPRLVEAILSEATEVIRAKPNVLIVATRHGLILANAGIDQSNLAAEDHGRRVLLLPREPDASAARLKARLDAQFGLDLGVIVSDSAGRPWRLGTVGIAIGAAGVPALWDRRGEKDLSGRPLEVTEVGFADAVATAAVLAMGEAAEGCPAALVRGADWGARAEPRPAAALVRPEVGGSLPMSGQPRDGGTYVALSGGVGGAKLSLGLAQLLGDRLTVIVNTGDDFEHLGLAISPDVDTALYTLAGIVNPETGWGRRDETWTFMEAIGRLGGPTWFRLGDGDLAMHVDRTQRLKAGETLTEFCAHAAARLGIAARVLPMTDDPLRTVVDTDAGMLAFQEYFVREQCRPAVRTISFDGAAAAKPAPQVLAALSAPTLAGIIICPSNPWLSVDPILAVPGLRDGAEGERRADRRRVADHCRQGRERPGGQDHGRAWPGSEQRQRRPPLRRADRRFRHRYGTMPLLRRTWVSRVSRHQYGDGHDRR